MSVTRRWFLVGGTVIGLASIRKTMSGSRGGVAPQPYFAHILRLVRAMQLAGEPLSPTDLGRITASSRNPTDAAVAQVEEILERYTLLKVVLDGRGAGQVSEGGAVRSLVEQGWRSFLVRVHNPNGLEQALQLTSTSAIAEGDLSTHYSMGTEMSRAILTRLQEPVDVGMKWLGSRFFTKKPAAPMLSGLQVEYAILQLYSRDRGRRTAYVQINGSGTPMGPLIAADRKSGVQLDFECLPSTEVRLAVQDWDGVGTVASFVIRDEMQRLYPAPAHRLEPDLDFQPQVYRADGETVRLPAGQYSVEVWRGPEYHRKRYQLAVAPGAATARWEVRLERWFNAAALGWYPGDTHIHASGCRHYEVPTTGVTPETMIRHVRGEALTVGDVLTWSPGFYQQKQFFTGHVYESTHTLGHPEFQAAIHASLQPTATPRDAESLIRYDIEVSGFPSSHSGHLVLLRLREQEYPGTQRLEDWPSWNLPILQWARAQGALAGYAHCGAGLAVPSKSLPNYDIPTFEYVGANEFLVDVTQDAVDFVSGGSLPPQTELNFWYHVLNCGFRVPMLGETDFPCFSDDRPGAGRTYVRLDRAPVGDSGFSEWVRALGQGRLYFGDGRSHFIDYAINGQAVGGPEVSLAGPAAVEVTALVAAFLAETPVSADDDHLTPDYAYWHLERARIGSTRNVAIEVVVNGVAVASQTIVADGKMRNFSARITVERSAWIALRILPSGHTAPVYVTVAREPVRASRRSAQWCLECVDALWSEKGHRIRPDERGEAVAAYEKARVVYRNIRDACSRD